MYPSTPKWITTEQAAEILGYHVEYVRRLARRFLNYSGGLEIARMWEAQLAIMPSTASKWTNTTCDRANSTSNMTSVTTAWRRH